MIPTAPLNARLRRLLLAVAACALAVIASAQVQVTGVTYGSLTDNANQTQGGLAFQEMSKPVTSVSSTVGDYGFSGPVASSITVRRNTSAGNANNSSLFYQTPAGNTASPYGNAQSTLESTWLSGNLAEGIRNPFANGTGTTQGNIERFDFRLANYTVQSGDALVFFDLENAGSFGDGFRIAAFTSWGTVNGVAAPTAYANAGTLIGAGTFGPAVNSPFDGTSGTFIRSTFGNGDNLTGTPSNSTLQTNLNLVGILIRFSDLGIAAGTTIQGFSIMAGDVTATSASQLVDWKNSSYYPTNTDSNTYGNIDFAGFGAQVSRPVPEPATYGAIFTGLALAFVAWRRRAARVTSPAA